MYQWSWWWPLVTRCSETSLQLCIQLHLEKPLHALFHLVRVHVDWADDSHSETCCCNSWGLHATTHSNNQLGTLWNMIQAGITSAAAYIDGAWVLLGNCMCDRWSPCWMFVMFRINFEIFCHRWCTNSVSLSFHTIFIHE
jgi:hypothetical protein